MKKQAHSKTNHHHHQDGCSHHENHRLILILYLVGLILFVLSFFLKNFKYVYFSIHLLVVIFAGNNVMIEGFKKTVTDSIKYRKFLPNIHVLMSLAVVFAFLIEQYYEGSLLIIIFAGAHFLEDFAQDKSKKDIRALLDSAPKYARLMINNQTKLVEVANLNMDDEIEILIGDKIPIDGILLTDVAYIDEKAISGESVSVFKKRGDQLFAGTLNTADRFSMKVNKLASETLLAKMILMVENTTEDHSKTSIKIKKIEPIYVTIVLLLTPIFFLFYYFLLQTSFDTSFYKTAVFLIAASPCALAATSIPATLSALSNLAKQGILFKGGSYIANFEKVKAIAFDKTGTLTTGVLSVSNVFYLQNDKIDYYHQIIVSMEAQANHPIAKAIVNYFDVSKIDLNVENEIGLGLKTTYDNHTYQLGKLKTQDIKTVKDRFLIHDAQTLVGLYEDELLTVVICLLDKIKDEVKDMIAYFKTQDIKTIMISGDRKVVAQYIQKQVLIDRVYANIMPLEKGEIIDQLKADYGTVAYVGDGINDALALKKSSLGISVGNGSDIAIETSDAVLVKNDMKKLVYAHKLSKKLYQIVLQNIIFACLIVVLLILSNTFFNINLPLAVVFHEGSTLVVILNGLRLLVHVKN